MAEQRKCKKLAAVLVEHQDNFGVLPDEDCQWAIQNPKDAITLFAEAVKGRSAETVAKLVGFVRTVLLPAVGTFVAAEKFRPSETIDGIKVGWLGDNFKKYFLGKTEEPMPTLEIREHTLLKSSRDPAIITELGGEEKVETTLGQLWEFLKTADQTLWYVRHIRDEDGVLWAVFAYWRVDSLSVEALSLDYPDDWNTGGRFLSR